MRSIPGLPPCANAGAPIASQLRIEAMINDSVFMAVLPGLLFLLLPSPTLPVMEGSRRRWTYSKYSGANFSESRCALS
jgi:hypothetical protein